MHITKHNL